MKKVYCKNCKWFSILVKSCQHSDYEYPTGTRDNKYFKADGIPLKKEKPKYLKILSDYWRYNKNNNCPYYKEKPKWWKFWV